MEEPRIVRETVEYEDGTIEERILRRKEGEQKEYEAPGDSWLVPLGLLVLGGFGLFVLWKYKDMISGLMGKTQASVVSSGNVAPTNKQLGPGETEETAPGGYSTPPTAYAAETPRPMVNDDEFVAPVQRSGRLIG